MNQCQIVISGTAVTYLVSIVNMETDKEIRVGIHGPFRMRGNLTPAYFLKSAKDQADELSEVLGCPIVSIY
jgi:hypothetical protein